MQSLSYVCPIGHEFVHISKSPASTMMPKLLLIPQEQLPQVVDLKTLELSDSLLKTILRGPIKSESDE